MKKLFKNLRSKMNRKMVQCAAQMHTFAANTSGSDTTEKIGMVVAAVVIVGLAVAAVNNFMPGLFSSIFGKAQTALMGMFA